MDNKEPRHFSIVNDTNDKMLDSIIFDQEIEEQEMIEFEKPNAHLSINTDTQNNSINNMRSK